MKRLPVGSLFAIISEKLNMKPLNILILLTLSVFIFISPSQRAVAVGRNRYFT